ncbi:MAG: DNA-processing protein DprA, partial [Acidimicrobiaceae bacterium]|nr:DNA-processing protein DprA [Acidimicrobiaceae bacterium]
MRRQPADLLGDGARALLEECRLGLDADRVFRLLDRGFLLSQAMERWRTRALWVTSRADAQYPRRLKKRLRGQAPPVLYGCGDRADLDSGGLAVVGSRNVDDDLIAYTEGVGRLAAGARRTLVSGGARGIDQAAMRGALDAGGTVACVLADGLERAATRREYRDALMDGRLVLICPYDPAAGFVVGHAMQRNKLIYALSDAALVVSAEFEKGGTWAGAVEQLDRHRFVSVYVRVTGEMGRGLDALLSRGARRWLNPDSPAALSLVLNAPPAAAPAPGLASLLREDRSDQDPDADVKPTVAPTPAFVAKAGFGDDLSPAEKLLARVKELLSWYLDEPRSEADVTQAFGVQKIQVSGWLERLVTEGAIERLSKPVRYRAAGAANSGSGCKDGLPPAEALLASARELLLPYLDE